MRAVRVGLGVALLLLSAPYLWQGRPVDLVLALLLWAFAALLLRRGPKARGGRIEAAPPGDRDTVPVVLDDGRSVEL